MTAAWRESKTLGGPDLDLPERAFPGMPNAGLIAEHCMRYAFAQHLVARMRVLDLGCGTGYGSEMLTWVAASVHGFDLWEPAPEERPQWPGGAVLTYGHDLCEHPLPAADAAVMFEVIEHLHDAPRALRHAFAAAPLLITSFPNPRDHGSHINKYHCNDWTLEQFERELHEAARPRYASLELTHWQQLQGAPLIVPGRDPAASYWIVVARASDIPVAASTPLPVDHGTRQREEIETLRLAHQALRERAALERVVLAEAVNRAGGNAELARENAELLRRFSEQSHGRAMAEQRLAEAVEENQRHRLVLGTKLVSLALRVQSWLASLRKR